MKNMLISALLILFLTTTPASAEPNAILGKAVTDQMAYNQSTSVTVAVQFLLENQTEYAWTFQNSSQRIFHYEVFDSTGTQVAQGNLQESQAQYVAPGQSDVFAYGNITLKKPASGFYRIYVYAPMFQSALYSSLTKNPSAGVAFKIVSK